MLWKSKFLLQAKVSNEQGDRENMQMPLSTMVAVKERQRSVDEKKVRRAV